MKRILLIGCGAEIGSLLLGMINPAQDGFCIAAIVTSPVATDPCHPELSSLDGLCARVVLARPELLDQVAVEGNCLSISGNRVPVFFGDLSLRRDENSPLSLPQLSQQAERGCH